MLVGIVGLCVVVVIASHAWDWACSPTGAVIWSATGLAAAARSYARAEDEEQQEADNDDSEDDPANPAIPCAALASNIAEAVAIAPSHAVRRWSVVCLRLKP